MVTISPTPIMILMIWGTGTPNAADSSFTVAPEATVTLPVGGGAGGALSRGGSRSFALARTVGTRPRGARVDHDSALAAAGASGSRPKRPVGSVSAVSHGALA